ncbi:glycosyltransferase family 2 protein [Ligilactobacillus agilis]|uniref:glycosyltransferase family 2 protein n=1 Tax=Ligilactobacillus agilis TaxID=1601 RepID=UPI001437A2E5|nr:glycosyltransferase family 2 protein [Ligilactobacillus agilis]GET19260.1 glycosyl transferase [Ligilactobacillus agilis]
MNSNLVSIIVPIYNVEKYLRKCVDSLLKQSYSNIEILLIDDGSTDNSGRISDEYSNYNNVRVYHKENGGLSDARNFGIEHSKGEFLAFVDSDDYVTEDYILRMLDKIQKTDVDIVACSYYDISEDGQILGKIQSTDRILNEKNFWDDIYINIKATPAYGVAWNKLYKRNVFENLRYRKGILNEDDDIIYDVIHGRNMFMMDDLLYYYRQRQGSIMDQMKKTFNIERIELIYRRLEKFKKNEQWEYVSYVLIEIAAIIINGLAISSNDEERRQCYSQLNKLKRVKNHIKRMQLKIPIKLRLKSYLYFEFPRFSSLIKKIKINFL